MIQIMIQEKKAIREISAKRQYFHPISSPFQAACPFQRVFCRKERKDRKGRDALRRVRSPREYTPAHVIRHPTAATRSRRSATLPSPREIKNKRICSRLTPLTGGTGFVPSSSFKSCPLLSLVVPCCLLFQKRRTTFDNRPRPLATAAGVPPRPPCGFARPSTPCKLNGGGRHSVR